MEQNPCLRRYVVRDGDDNKLLKRNDTCVDQPVTCHFADDLKVGFLYEIDHKQLPPKYPIQLRVIRVVMLAKMNELNVSVRFPSPPAFRAYFSSKALGDVPGKKYLDLDEQFVMGLKIAKKVLRRQTLPPEFLDQGRLRSFWLLPPEVPENSSSVLNENSRGETSVIGDPNSSLNYHGLLNWGVRRRITFKLKTPRVPWLSSLIKEEGEETVIDEAAMCVNRKLKRGSFKHKKKSIAVKRTCDQEKKPITKMTENKLQLSYNRWSQERYKSAEVKMLEIMKEQGAVFGRPMLRPTLRMEARKHIGDTGLLDHLLNYMAGKVAPNGEDRFRRRHNADRTMEYWLESVDLVNIRKEAGVNDPYWTPPPGWKPGDSLSQDPNSSRELTLIKEEMTIIRGEMQDYKRDMQELLLWKREHSNGDKAIEPSVKLSTDQTSILECDNRIVSTNEDCEDYMSLVKRKAEMEEQLLQISKSLEVMEEEMKGSREKAVIEANLEVQILEATGESDKKEINEEEKKEAERAEKAAKKCIQNLQASGHFPVA